MQPVPRIRAAIEVLNSMRDDAEALAIEGDEDADAAETVFNGARIALAWAIQEPQRVCDCGDPECQSRQDYELLVEAIEKHLAIHRGDHN